MPKILIYIKKGSFLSEKVFIGVHLTSQFNKSPRRGGSMTFLWLMPP